MNMKTYEKIYNAVANVAFEGDESLTLKSWQNRCVLTRKALQIAADQHEANLKILRDTYQPRIAEERAKPYTEEFSALCELARARCLDDLNAVIRAKRQAFSDANSAPDEEQMRLLTALKMRESLTAVELSQVADKTAGNYLALRILSEIAEKHGLPFPRIDARDIENDFERVQGFCERMIDSVTVTNDRELSGRAFAFFKHPETQTEADAIFSGLDGNVLTAARARTTREAEQAAQKAAIPSANAVRVHLRGDESLAGISLQFNIDSAKIREANPEYDFSTPFSYGDKLIVPAGKLRITNNPGAIIPEQCVPCRYDPPAPRTDGEVVDVTTI